MPEILFDLLRAGHMLSFAVGIGAAVFLEHQTLKRFRHHIDADGLTALLAGHHLITIALIGLWVTGVSLFGMRLFVLDGELSAKLVAKFFTVLCLTGNMLLIHHHVIPELFVYEGRPISRIPRLVATQLGAIAGLSAGCWVVALALGSIGLFQSMDLLMLSALILPALAISAVIGAVTGFVVSAFQRSRTAQAVGE